MIQSQLLQAGQKHFSGWTAYWGQLDQAAPDDTIVFGFENVSTEREADAEIPAGGTCFGYVASGGVAVCDADGDVPLVAEQWFSLPNGCRFVDFASGTRILATWKRGFRGLRAFGGPIERRGRLKYIDRCSDTLLAAPARSGDPCLNHLHFPQGVEQTEHTHPSVRCGIVARGSGFCETPNGNTPLVPGLTFLIPAGGRHRFVTETEAMDVIAYHPDTDWGPTDEKHPMVNRTLVDGQKIDNTAGVHAEAEVIGR